MDDHARRVCAPLRWGWDDFRDGRATPADLSRLAKQARDAVDDSSAPLKDLLWRAAIDLMSLHYEGERDTDMEAAERILAPVFVQLDSGG